jgi:sugar lactone lactonase YvrE
MNYTNGLISPTSTTVSSSSSASVQIVFNGLPTAPTISGTSDLSRVTLSWAAPASPLTISDYIVQYRLGSSGSWTTFSDGTSGTPGAIVTGLTVGSAYQFQVAAVTSDGTGPYSSPVSVTVNSDLIVTFASSATVPVTSSSFTATGVGLTINLGYAPTAGQKLTLVNNTGTNAITGTFTGLAAGSEVTATYSGDTFKFTISYSGGTGNDIVLTRASGVGGGVVSTVAGSGSAGSANGTGTSAAFSSPGTTAVDASGNVYVADTANHVIRKIDSNGAVTTLAGTAGSAGSTNGTGAAARFSSPAGIVVDAAGANLYVADTGNHQIRKIVVSTGVVTTVAGATSTGTTDATGTSARFSSPKALAINSAGTELFVADSGNHRIRKVVISTTAVTTIAGSTNGFADGNGTAARFSNPSGIAVDSTGAIWVADTDNARIRKVTAASPFTVSTVVDSSGGLAGLSGGGEGGNLIRNGNFQSGNTNFTSAYGYVAPDAKALYPEGLYSIVAQASQVHDAFSTSYDKTLGTASGKFFVANAAPDTTKTVWQSMPIGVSQANSPYRFEAYITKVHRDNPPSLVFEIGNGTTWQSLGTTASLSSSSVGAWVFTYADGRFSQPGVFYVRLKNNNNAAGGNDLGVDDIYFGIRTAAPSIGSTPGSTTVPSYNVAGISGILMPIGITVDGAGNLYVTDAAISRIRKFENYGAGTNTFLGSATAGWQDGPSTTARFYNPTGVAIDPLGNLFVADSGNHRIRQVSYVTPFTPVLTLSSAVQDTNGVTLSGTVNPNGFITTATFLYGTTESNLNQTAAVTLPGANNGNSAQNVSANLAGLAVGTYYYRLTATNVDGTENTDVGTFTVFPRWNTATANFASAATVPVSSAGMNVEGATFNLTLGFAPGPGASVTLLNNTSSSPVSGTFAGLPQGATVTASYGGDTFNFQINYTGGDGNDITLVRVGGPGQIENVIVSTLAGTGVYGSLDGAGGSATFKSARGLAVDLSGNIYVTEDGNSIRKISPSGVVSTFAGSSTGGSANGTGGAASFSLPRGIALDSTGTALLVADASCLIRRIEISSSNVTTLAGTGWGWVDGPAASAAFAGLTGIAVDSTGNVYVSENLVGGSNNRGIRKISSGGTVTTLAGTNTTGFADGTGSAALFNNAWDLVADGAGNVFVADSENHRIRKITPAGVVTTWAGTNVSGTNNGIGVSARFNYPFGLAIDSAGNLYVGDTGNYRIRKITPAGGVSTLAGGSYGFQDGPGNVARFYGPRELAVDTAGTVYVTDANRIRKLTADYRPILTLGTASQAGSDLRLTGTVNPNGFITTARFEYGTNSTNLNLSTNITLSPSNGTNALAVTNLISGLTPNITNFFRLTASNVDGVAVTTNGSFRLLPPSTVTFASVGAKTYGDAAFTVSATSSGGSTLNSQITYTSSDTNVATVVGNLVTIRGAGPVTITASHPGTASAGPGNATLNLNIAKVTLTARAANLAYPAGQVLPAFGLVYAGFVNGDSPAVLDVAPTISSSPSSPTAAGTYTLTAAGGSDNSYDFSYATGTLTLLNAGGKIPLISASEAPINVGSFSGSGWTLDVDLGLAPGASQVLTLVNNLGSSLVAAPFANLAEGDTFTATFGGDTFNFRISYTGGDGNDVTLTRLLKPGQAPVNYVSTLAGSGATNRTDGAGTNAGFSFFTQRVASIYPSPVLKFNSAGNLIVREAYNSSLVRVVTPSGQVSTVSRAPIYSGNYSIPFNLPSPWSAALADLYPEMVSDTAGNAYFFGADYKIRRVTPAGVVSVLTNSVYPHVAADTSGNVYLGSSSRIDRTASNGTTTTLPPSATWINGIAASPSGEIHISDSFGYNVIWSINASNQASVLVGPPDGRGSGGYRDGPARNALVDIPAGIAVDPAGVVYFIDAGNQRIRKVAPAAPPIVTLAAATGGTNGSVLGGTVNPNGYITTARIEYGTSSSNLNLSTNVVVSPNHGTNAVSVSAEIPGLTASSIYYYRLVAQNIDGSSATSVSSFRPSSTATPQSISFGALASKTYGDSAFSLLASASSGLTVSYTSSDSSVASVSGNTVTLVGAGTATITARQDGNSQYSAAAPVSQSLNVGKKTVTVTADDQSRAYGASNPTFTATFGGLVGSDSPVNSVSGVPAFTCVANTTSSPGTFPIQVSAGTLSSSKYSFSFTAGTLTVTAIPTTITWNRLTNSTTAGSTPSSMPVEVGQYQFNTNFSSSIAGAPDLTPVNPLGTSRFTNETVRGTLESVYRFEGNRDNASQAGLTLNVGGLLPTNSYSVEMVVSFDAASGWRRIIDVMNRNSDSGFYVNPSSHLAVYPVQGGGAATFTPSEYHHVVMTVAPDGKVMGYINGQPDFTFNTTLMNIDPANPLLHFFLDNIAAGGQGEYSSGKIATLRLYDIPLTGEQVLALAGAAGTVPAPSPIPGVSLTTQPAGASYTITYESSTYPASTNVPTLPGSYTVVVTANSPYTGTTTNTYTIAKRTQSVVFQPLAQTIPLNQLSNVAVAATASSGLPVTLSLGANSAAQISGVLTNGTGVLDNIAASGVVTLRAVQTGNSVYEAATNVTTIDVTKISQSILFDQELPNRTYSNGLSIPLTAVSSSTNLPVSYVVNGPATVSNNILGVTGAGVVTVEAQQSGDSGTAAAAPITRSFEVAVAENSISFNQTFPGLTYDTGVTVNLTATSASGEPVVYRVIRGPGTILNGVLTVTGAGDIVIQAVQEATDGFTAASAERTLSVLPKPLTITAVSTNRPVGQNNPPFAVSYSGLVPGDTLRKPAVVTTGADATSAPGTYALTPASAESENYLISYSTSGVLTVQQASPTLSWVPQTNPAVYGTPLTSAQLGASAGSVPGTITYTVNGNPVALGGILPAGTSQLVATFTPADTTSYATVTLTNPVIISPRSIQILADDQGKVAGVNDPSALTYRLVGSLVDGDSLTGSLGRDSGNTVGSYNITLGTLAVAPSSSASNYDLQFTGASFTVSADPLAVIRDYAGSNTAPTEADYTTAGITGVGAGNLAAINSAFALLASGESDSAPEIQNVVDSYNRILAEANGSAADADLSASPSATDYTNIGVDLRGLPSTSGGLSLLNDVVGAQSGSGVGSVGQVQALVDVVDALMRTAGGLVVSPALTASDLTLIGLTDVTSANLESILSAIGAGADDGFGIATLSSLQGLINAYNVILASADGNQDGDDAANAAQYAAIGVTGVTSGAGESLLGDVIDGSGSTAVDTVSKIQGLADAVAAVLAGAAGTANEPTLADLQALGISGATSGNLAAIQAAIAATADNGSGVATVSDLQSVVDGAINGLNALAVISGYTGSNTAPTTSDYGTAGITGVTADNLAGVNSTIGPLASAATDTVAEVQGVVDAFLRILGEANGSAGDLSLVDPSEADYLAVGVTLGDIAGNANGLSLLNDGLGVFPATSADSLTELNTLADLINRLLDTAAGLTASPALTPADFTSLGLSGVTNSTLASVLTAIGTTADDGSGIATLADLQSVIDNAIGSSISSALAIITAYDGTQTGAGIPAVTTYENVGVNGVSAGNLNAINDAIAGLIGSEKYLQPQVQGVVDSYNRILDQANGAAADNDLIYPLASDYTVIGVNLGALEFSSGGLFLLNDVVGGLTGPAVDTVSEIQALVGILDRVLITAADGTPSPALTVTDLATIGVTVPSGNLAAFLSAVAATANDGSGVATIAVLQGIQNAYAEVFAAAAGASNKPTLAELQALGIAGVTADNLANVQAAIRGTADSGSGIDTIAELQAVVDTVSGAGAAALAKISGAAGGNSATASDPTVADYTAAGVTGVDATNLAAINSALNTTGINSAAADTMIEVQAIVDAYAAILAVADGNGGNGVAPTAAQYSAIGVTGVTAGASADLLGSVIDALSSTAVDTAGKVQTLADAVAGVLAGAAGTANEPTLADLTALGFSSVDSSNLAAVQAAIAATADSGTGVDSLSELQAIVSGAVNSFNALATISGAAENNTATDNSPADSVYVAAGVTGVNTNNLASINSVLNTGVNGVATDSTAKVQVIVDAYTAILSLADSTGGTAAGSLPSAASYGLLGVTGVSGASHAGLLGSVIDGKSSGDVDRVSEIQALADAVADVIAGAAGTAGQPTLADLTALGVTGADATNLALIQAAIAGTDDNGSGVDSLTKLQTLVDGVLSSISSALATISGAAENNTATATSPAASDYASAAVTGVDATNLAAINSALNTAAINSAAADTAAEVQAIVDAYAAVLAAADGGLLAGTAPTELQYSQIGVTGVSGATMVSLLGEVIDAKSGSDVDSVTKVQDLAVAVAGVLAGAGGTANEPTLTQLTDLGFSSVNSSNLADVQAAIAAAGVAGVDTLGELQSVIAGAVTLSNALAAISDAADNDTATSGGLAVAVYEAAGVLGVDANNVAAINSALDSTFVTGVRADTTTEIQTIVDAYNAVLGLANGTGGTNAGSLLPGGAYGSLGVSGVTAGASADLLGSVIDVKLGTDVDTVVKLQALADAVKAVLDAANGVSGVPSLAQLQLLGVTGVNASNLAAYQAALRNTDDSGTGADSLAKMQGLVPAIVANDDSLSRDGIGGATTKIAFSQLVTNDYYTTPAAPTVSLPSGATAQGGTVAIDNGWVVYTSPSALDPSSTDSFVYQITDSLGNTSTATVYLAAGDYSAVAVNIVWVKDANFPGTGKDVSFAVTPNRYYRIYATSSLMAPINWQDLGSGSVYGGGVSGSIIINDPGAGSQRFYKLEEYRQ